MSRDTDKDWEKISEDNPYWGVLSSEQFRGHDISSSQKKLFFLSGQEFVLNTIGFVKKHISVDFKIQRALDFGCGVGRLLIPLAELAVEVVGVDVAPRMLQICQQNMAEAGVINGTVVLGDDSLSQIAGEFNFVNSYIVLQHIPPDRAVHLIKKLLNFLSVGGVFSLQLTYAKERRFLSNETGAAGYYRRHGAVIVDLLESRAMAPEGTITMYDHDLNEIMLLISQVSGEPLMVIPTNHAGHIGVHLIGMKAKTLAVR